VTGKRGNGTKITVSLPGVVKIVSTWRTPATTEPGVTLERLETADGQPWTPGQRAYDKHTGRVAQVGLTHEVLATWPTPRTTDQASGRILTPDGQRTNAAGTMTFGANISDLVHLYATWPTPLQQDCRVPATPESAQREWDHSNLRGIAAVTTWPTPTSQDCARGVGTIRPQDTGIPLPQRVAQVIGTTTSGSPDQTGKPGALNPAFPCWLMGYPTEWDDCAPTVTPSSRKSRRKSLKL
jgi:hypothetical protein